MPQLPLRMLLTFFVAAMIVLVAPPPTFAAPATTVVPSTADEAKLVIRHRHVATFRVAVLGVPPAVRAQRAKDRIDEMIAAPGEVVVDALPIPQGRVVRINGVAAFGIATEDAETLDPSSLDAATEHAVAALRTIAAETREARDVRAVTAATLRAGLATLAAIVVLVVALRLRGWVESTFARVAQSHADRLSIEGVSLVRRERVLSLSQRFLRLLFAGIVLLVAYVYVGFVLAQFPFTRAWGEQLNGFLVGVASQLGDAVLEAMPDLFVAAVIFLATRLVVRFVRALFDRIAAGEITVRWLDPDLAATTRRIVVVVIWLFGLAAMYPYLPGANTDAFKGLSVLIGLMISLGASGVVGQALSGLILTYSRALKAGEFVRIGEHEGTVMEVGVFTTRIRTGMGEELTVPNSYILANVTRNFSRAVKGAGYIVDATVTIGYDTPWRQVHAMLVEAARRTPGVLEEPAPRVFQTALSDFYPEYRLVCQAIPSDPHPRAETLATLHANIQDVFNEYGVQIMSPHYLGDPAVAKVVPKEEWHRAPATAERPTPRAAA